jgi:hypothetical protein
VDWILDGQAALIEEDDAREVLDHLAALARLLAPETPEN